MTSATTSVSFTEHHFHIEGFELSNNPVLLDLYFAMQTKRIRVGQLGIVLPAANPIRVAEDIAMLDHMTSGRACAGFARGYQRRWVDIMAQQTHGIHGALPHQHDEIDAANRAAFEENFQIIKKCWTEEMLTFDGKYWKVPAGETPVVAGHHHEVGQGGRERHPEVGRRGAEAGAEAASAAVPALRLVGELHPLGGAGGCHRDPAVDAAGLREQAVRRLCRGVGPPARRGNRPAARRDHRRHGRGGDGAVAQLRPVLRPRLVRAVRLPPRLQDPKTGGS